MASSTAAETSDLTKIRERVRQKRHDYIRYDFSRIKNDILKTFFDLAQEYDSLPDFFRICVVIPQEALKVDCRLYLVKEDSGNLELVCESQSGLVMPNRAAPNHIRQSERPYEENDSYVVPIFRRQQLITEESHDAIQPAGVVMGMFEVYPVGRLTELDKFFFTKYSNRIGFNLHNRKMSRQNIRHLKFINNLVKDIEHNVIVPNMYFKHLFNILKRKLAEFEELEETIVEMKKGMAAPLEACETVINRVTGIRQDLQDFHQELLKHHASYSLSLESLFRRDHFAQGHFVLRPKMCMVEKEIIDPQLEHYRKRMQKQGISIVRPRDMLEEEFPLLVDIGLLSQVYDNLFSNAVKYTEEVVDHTGCPRKEVAYGREILPGYFGPGNHGVKFNVFTTGRHLSEADRKMIFSDGFRGSNIASQAGTGHGLAFIKQVVEIHGGQAGYESTFAGNNFYFILPVYGQETAPGRVE